MPANNDNENAKSGASLTPGMLVNHYRIIEKIGAGGMGEIYLAEDTKLNRKVALKFLPPHLCQDADCRSRFKREAQAAAKLNHPHIVTIYEVGVSAGRPYIAMEYVEGESLESVFAKGKQSIQRVLEIADQIAGGLIEAHRQGVIHRDIKPANIQIDKNGRVKLLDFGLAAVTGASKLTRSGGTIGTIHYMSPEQIRGEKVDVRTDIFSFGIVLYEMVTTHHPFPGEHEAAVMYGICYEEPKSMAELSPDIPPDFEGIIGKMMEKDPPRRFQTAQELRDRLSPLMENLRVHDTSPGSPTGAQAADSPNSLAIMHFANIPNPQDTERLGQIISSLLITGLSDIRGLAVTSSQRLYDLLKQMGKDDPLSIDQSVATQLARRAKAGWMLLGSILNERPHLVVSAQLVEVQTGTVLTGMQIAGDPSDTVFIVADRLVALIQQKLPSLIADGTPPNRSVGALTTHSPEAYRWYVEGERFAGKLYWAEARRCYDMALQYDPCFAMAHYGLSWVDDERLRESHAANAVKYSDKATFRERCYIKARMMRLHYDYAAAISELETLLEQYPQEVDALYQIGLYYHWQSKYSVAAQYFERAIGMDPHHRSAYNQLAYVYDRMGDLENALLTLGRFSLVAPNDANLYDTKAEIYSFHGKIDPAIESCQQALAIKPNLYPAITRLALLNLFKNDHGEAQRWLGCLAGVRADYPWIEYEIYEAVFSMYQGKFRQALRQLGQKTQHGDASIAAGTESGQRCYLRALLHAENRQIGKAQREIEMALDPTRESSLKSIWSPGNYLPVFLHIRFLCEEGNQDRARKMTEQLKDGIEEFRQSPRSSSQAHSAGQGIIAFVAADYAQAIEYLNAALGQTGNWPSAAYFLIKTFLGRAWLNLKRPDEAVSQFEQIVDNYGPARIWVLPEVIRSHYYLGQAYEMSAWHKKAIEQYEIFLTIWKEADPGLIEVEDAKARLARLKAASR